MRPITYTHINDDSSNLLCQQRTLLLNLARYCYEIWAYNLVYLFFTLKDKLSFRNISLLYFLSNANFHSQAGGHFGRQNTVLFFSFFLSFLFPSEYFHLSLFFPLFPVVLMGSKAISCMLSPTA